MSHSYPIIRVRVDMYLSIQRLESASLETIDIITNAFKEKYTKEDYLAQLVERDIRPDDNEIYLVFNVFVPVPFSNQPISVATLKSTVEASVLTVTDSEFSPTTVHYSQLLTEATDIPIINPLASDANPFISS